MVQACKMELQLADLDLHPFFDRMNLYSLKCDTLREFKKKLKQWEKKHDRR